MFDNGGRGRWLTCCQDEEDDGRGGGHCGHHRDTPARHSWQHGNLAGFLSDDISYNEVVIYTYAIVDALVLGKWPHCGRVLDRR